MRYNGTPILISSLNRFSGDIPQMRLQSLSQSLLSRCGTQRGKPIHFCLTALHLRDFPAAVGCLEVETIRPKRHLHYLHERLLQKIQPILSR